MKLRFTNALTSRPSRVASAIDKRGYRFLNLGSGPRGLPAQEWLNVDGFQDRNVELLLDFNRQLPFPSNRFEGIFCEHVIEHFDLTHGEAVFKECLRVLKPGGCLRVIVPDGEKILKSYVQSPSELIARRGNGTAFAIDAVNEYFRQRYEHQYTYDWPMMQHQLTHSGFNQIRRVSYKQGIASREILLDDSKYEWESLYVEAVKP